MTWQHGVHPSQVHKLMKAIMTHITFLNNLRAVFIAQQLLMLLNQSGSQVKQHNLNDVDDMVMDMMDNTFFQNPNSH
jgi:hypothetical protein